MFEDIIANSGNKKVKSKNVLLGQISIYEREQNDPVAACKKCGHIGNIYIELEWIQDNNKRTEKHCFNCFHEALKHL